PAVDAADDLDWPGYIWPERVGHAVDRAVAGYYLDRVAALRLDDRGELPALDGLVAAKWQFVDRADDDAMSRVEIRKAQVAAQVIAVLHDDALQAERIIVE